LRNSDNPQILPDRKESHGYGGLQTLKNSPLFGTKETINEKNPLLA